MKIPQLRWEQVRLFGSAVMSQALLSAANFIAGLLLIRQASNLEYGYYVLVMGGVLLLSSLQGAFIGPPLVARLTRLDLAGRRGLVGGLYREQSRLAFVAAALFGAAVLILLALEMIEQSAALLLLTSTLAAMAVLSREYFRMVLLAHRRAVDALRADACFIVVFLAGVEASARSALPAAFATLALAAAAVVGAVVAARALKRHEDWDPQGSPGILRQIAPVAAWSMAGAAIHWTFTQGYSYLVAATLDVPSVASLAATRLLMMPVNFLSLGIGSLMLPLASRWLHEHGPTVVFQRLLQFSAGVGIAALCYFAVLWMARDWVFDSLLKKSFPERDTLLVFWSLAFLVMACRDQLLYLLVARQRFRRLSVLALVSAIVALGTSLWAMQRLGPAGAPLGIVAGEMLNLIGVVAMSLREIAGGARARVITAPVEVL